MKKTCWIILLLIGLINCVCASKKPLPLKPPKQGGIYVVAHRGAHEGIPENTLPAYQKAIDLGVDFVEIDVRTTQDGKLVSMHNSTIDAYVPGASGKVSDFTLAELRALDVGSRVGPEWAGAQIPTFEEILDLCQGRCGIYLDLKQAPVAPLVELIKARGMEHDVIWYADVDELEELKKLCPECIPMPDPGPETHLAALIQRLQPTVIASSWKHLSPNFVQACHDAGALVIVDEETPDCWQDMLTWGTDGIQTDHPAELIDLLKRRTQ